MIDHLMYLGSAEGIPSRQLRERANEMSEAVDLRASTKTRLNNLSGGMLRRVGIAQT